MPKINREEYEVLKELDDEWKWITRDMNSKTGEIGGVRVFKEKPSRMKHYHFNVGGVINENWKYLDRTLFNFIDWDISEPYSIAELIEEYEYSTEHVSHVVNERVKALGKAFSNESEETEVKKLKSVITEFSQESQEVNSWEGSFTGGYLSSIGFAEVEISSESPLDRGEYLGKEVTIIVGDDEPEVLSQELPVIPKFVAEWIKETKPYNSLRVAFEYIAQRKRDNHDDKLAFWVEEGNSETFARAWLDGYTVEEEQKYYLKIGNLYLAEPLGDMTSDIVRMTRDKGVAYQFTDEKSIATHLDKFEGTEAVKVEELEEC